MIWGEIVFDERGSTYLLVKAFDYPLYRHHDLLPETPVIISLLAKGFEGDIGKICPMRVNRQDLRLN